VISAVIFDLDGTLLETEELKALSYARAAAKLDPEVQEEDVRAAYAEDLVGHSRREVAQGVLQRFDLEEAARARMEDLGEDEPWKALVNIRVGMYEEILGDDDLLIKQRYQHNIDLLREMREAGYPTACATMSHRYQVERVLTVLELEDAFDVISTADDIENGKPDPEIDLLVAEKMNTPPEEFLVVEDSPAGVQAAVAAGMKVVAVPTEITRPSFQKSEIIDPRWVVEDPGDLREVVNERIKDAGGSRIQA